MAPAERGAYSERVRHGPGPRVLLLWTLLLSPGLPALPGTRVAAAADAVVAAELAVLQKHASDPFEQDQRAAAIRRLGGVGGPEAAAALLPLFDDPFEHLADHAVSAWITMLRGARAPETQTWLAKAGLGARSAAARGGAAIALGLTGGSELADAWRGALARRDEAPDVLVALARGAGSARGGALVPEAFLPLLAHADGRVVLAAAEVAGAAGEGAVPALRRAIAHKEPLARAGALLGLERAGRLSPEDVARGLADKAAEPKIALAEVLPRASALLPLPGDGEALLTALLGDASWRVRAAAIEAALRLWSPRVVPGLIERLGVETGRLRHAALEALRTLTGMEHPEDAEVWRRWWSAQSEAFDLGPRPAPDRFGRLRRAAPGAAGPGAGPGETRTTQFFNLPLVSQRLVFLFDLSGSMSRAASREDGPSKLDLTRQEFGRVLEGLPEGTALDLLVWRYPSTFPPKPLLTRALGKVAPLTPASRKRTLDWLGQQPAKGWGAFYEGLLAAAAEDVDTVVLLSDGVPSRGRYERASRLVDEWVRANRFRRLFVDTVLVGEKGTDREFMEELAWASGGHASVARLGR